MNGVWACVGCVLILGVRVELSRVLDLEEFMHACVRVCMCACMHVWVYECVHVCASVVKRDVKTGLV